MLPLAEWIMRGRGQALRFILITLVTSPIFWPINSILGAAALSLVWLRHGAREGTLLLVWALLPSIMIAIYLGQFTPLVLVCSVSAASWVLKQTVSLNYALLTLTVCCLTATVGVDQLTIDSLSRYVEAMNNFVQEFQQQSMNPQVREIFPETIETSFVAGLFGCMLIVGSCCSLILARSWQAKLYNPGGFQQEFHRLRLGTVEIAIYVLLAGLFIGIGGQYMTWVLIALFPVLIAGIGLFHAIALSRKIATHWYVIFYCMLLFWDGLKVILVTLAIVDSFIDIRSRLPEHRTDSDS